MNAATNYTPQPTLRLIGISGTNGAGKDTAAHFLMDRGYKHVSTGDVLRAEATRRGLSHERPVLIELAKTLGQERGDPHALVSMAVNEWRQAGQPGGLVMSGLRILGEAQEFKRLSGTLLFIDAPVELRYGRMQSRQRDAEANQTLAEFVAHDRIEYEGLGGESWPNLRAIQQLSDIVIMNDDTEPVFMSRLGDRLFGILD